MEKELKNNKNKTKYLLKLSFCFTLLLVAFLLPQYSNKSFAAEKQVCYLSDIPYIREQSSVGWGNITLDQNLDSKYNNGLITLIVNGEQKRFLKGVAAHATSTLVYDISGLNYDYFSTYYGIDASRGNAGNGVQFSISTSVDGENWTLHTLVSPPIKKGNSEAEYIEIDIRGKKYIKLYCSNRGNADSDHAVYANAKFYKEGYEEGEQTTVNFIKTLAQYDEIIKSHEGQEIKGDYELAILQRKFVEKVDYDLLQLYVALDEEKKQTVEWLMSNVENLRLYMLGGTPNGSYISSLNVLNELYHNYKQDFKIQELSESGIIKKGDLYKKMAITLSLTHSSRVGLWMQAIDVNNSNAVERYRIYKKMYDEGNFKVTKQGENNATQTIDITPWFESYSVEEMRWVLGTAIDDEEILWLNEYTQTRIDKQPGSAWGLLTPHPYMAYVWPNYANPVYYDINNKDYFNELFAVEKRNEDGTVTKKGLFEYVPYRNDTSNGYVYKLWMNFRNQFGTGAVCGGISKSGHCIRGVNGIASAVIGQPGHAALLYYTRNSEGKGYWGIDNDVSGWAYSEKGERMLLGWGNDRTYVSGYNVPYIVLAQEAINDYDNLEKAEKLLMTVDTYKDNKAKQEEIYKKAIEIQSINLDAWAGLAKLYMEDSNKTEEDYYNLEKEMMEALKCFPFTMYNLSNYIKTKLTSNEYIFKFTNLQTKILTEAKDYPNEGSQVLQPSLTRGLSAYLLGQIDTSLASFSFDGDDAGKIVLSNKFDGNGVRWDYSLDGKVSWNEVSSTAENHKYSLSDDEIALITAENDIYIHIVGTNYSEENIYKIDIQESEGLPVALYANDLENKMFATNQHTQWRYTENDEWTLYSITPPDLTGNKTLQLRQGATGTRLPSNVSPIYNFTEDNQPDTRKYITIDHLSIHNYSTQSKDNTRPFFAPNAIDGNANTLWHTDFSQNVLQQPTKPFITIKLDEPKNISALEFTQKKYPGRPQDPDDIRNARVYVSVNGETWIQAGKIENCETYGELYAINFEKPVYGQYVKIEMDTKNMFSSLALVNLYEDTTIVTLATFSFDGENAGKIVITDEFKGANWQYSLDSGENWENGTGDEHQLTTEQLEQINTEDKIKIRLTNSNKTSTIDIQKQNVPVISAYLNDLENRLIGISNIANLEWRLEPNTETETANLRNKTWISYAEQEPVVPGNTKLIIREKANSILMASDPVEFIFTEDNQPNSAKYVPIKHLSIESCSTESPSRGEGKQNAIDGNANTMWHTDHVTPDPNRYIIIKLDEPRYISKLQYVKKSNYLYGVMKNGIISTSMDGENWETVATIENLYNPTNSEELRNSEERKDIIFEKVQKAQYIKLQCTNSCDYVNGSRNGVPYDYFLAATMLNLFEDITKIEVPTAEIEYSIIDPNTNEKVVGKDTTNQNVIATLVNENMDITVTNNDGSKTHTFTENGEFTFEFVNSKGMKGTAKAKVDWIVKTLPTANIEYSITTPTNQDVTARVTFDRNNVKILNEADEEIETITTGNAYTYTFTENDSHEVKFKGPYGNKGKTVLNVNWIDKDAPIGTITYSSTNPSNQDVTATVTFNEEVTITNSDGSNVHTFTENGEYTFNFVDKAGNQGSATANVKWIDKTLPTAIITYSTENLTNQDVTATVTFTKNDAPLEGVTVEGGNTHTFENNGIHEFKFVGPAGNRGIAVAKVNWIDKDAPIGTIEYSTTNLTNKDVTATITFNEEVTITNNNGKNTYVFPMNGEFEFQFVDKAGNQGTATAEVEWIDKRQINASITYDINDITNKDVTATITFDKANVVVEGGNTHTFTENGIHEFRFVGPAGNTGTAIAEVTWIDKTPPAATVTYDKTQLTNKNVTATVTFDEGGVTIVNEQGEEIENGNKHVFTQNGSYTFHYIGPLGNRGEAVAIVNWIDKTAPTAQIKYSTTSPTNKAVVVTLVNPSEEITITNNNGSNTYTFTKNGTFTFEFLDKVGNKGTATAKVSCIDKTAPTAKIEYSTTELTNKNVTVKLVNASEQITIINNNGSNTYTFTKNGTFTFEFIDKAGNRGRATAKVSCIDKTVPTAEIEYSTTKPTNGNVTVKLVNASEQITIKNNNGSDTYTFTQNGEFAFEFVDKAGNIGIAIAKVDWIKKDQDIPPVQHRLGDINNDGKITATDLILVKRHLVAGKKQEWILSQDKFTLGDINKDNAITATDLILIKRLLLKEMKNNNI